MDRPPVIKLLTLGDSGSGKSSLLLRYTDDEFSDEFVTTIGMDFKFKRVYLDNKPVKVQIWDTAGQERFRTITQNYYRGAHGIALVCSVDDDDSKANVKKWLKDVRRILATDAFDAIIIMNKIDICPNQEEIEKEVQEIADELGLDYVLTSAKANIGVQDAFRLLIEKVHSRLYGSTDPQAAAPTTNEDSSWLKNAFGSTKPKEQQTENNCC